MSERKELHILHDDGAEKRSRSKWTRGYGWRKARSGVVPVHEDGEEGGAGGGKAE